MEILDYDNRSELHAFKEPWSRLSEKELQFVPSFDELIYQLEGGTKFRLLVAVENSQIIAMACFVFRTALKRYEIATRKLFDLPVEEVSLFGSCVLGEPDEGVVEAFFQRIIQMPDYDVITVGEIFIDSPLHKVITNLPGFVAWRVMRQAQLRWFVRLPDTFDEYLSSLRSGTRRRIPRYGRMFEKASPAYRVMFRLEEVGTFLQDAESISRLTYQWNLGYKIRNDKDHQERFARLATNKTFRGYVAYLQGKPCAFGWGELCHQTFNFVATGYDPQYQKLSPGTALIMKMIQDLIENTDCQVFDFGVGGKDGYKSKLCAVSRRCARMQLATMSRPYSLLIVALDQTLNLVKNLVMKSADMIVHGAIKQRLKSVLRQYGVGTY